MEKENSMHHIGFSDIEGKKYRTKTVYVHAWQNIKGIAAPIWVTSAAIISDDGKAYYRRGQAAVLPNQGDWIVRDEMGNVGIFEADEFKRAFEECVI